MKRAAMQSVVNQILVQSDCLYEIVKDPSTLEADRVTIRQELSNLCEFLAEAKNKRFDISQACYAFDKKLSVL